MHREWRIHIMQHTFGFVSSNKYQSFYVWLTVETYYSNWGINVLHERKRWHRSIYDSWGRQINVILYAFIVTTTTAPETTTITTDENATKGPYKITGQICPFCLRRDVLTGLGLQLNNIKCDERYYHCCKLDDDLNCRNLNTLSNAMDSIVYNKYHTIPFTTTNTMQHTRLCVLKQISQFIFMINS